MRNKIRKPIDIQWWNFIFPMEIPLQNRKLYSFKWEYCSIKLKIPEITHTLYLCTIFLWSFGWSFIFFFVFRKSISTCCHIGFNNTLNSSFWGVISSMFNIMEYSSPSKIFHLFILDTLYWSSHLPMWVTL